MGLWSLLLFREFDLGDLPWVQLGEEARMKGSLMSNGAGN